MQEDERYILEGRSFVDTKTNQCLNFGLKDLERVCIALNNQDTQIGMLQQQLKNAIVPKFNIGQKVWVVDKNYIRIKDYETVEAEIIGICFKYDARNIFRKWYLLKFKYGSKYQFLEKNIFNTKAEAEEKLIELQSE